MKNKECDGKFATTKFLRNSEFERAASDRASFCEFAELVGADGYTYSAPKGFSGWEFKSKFDQMVTTQ